MSSTVLLEPPSSVRRLSSLCFISSTSFLLFFLSFFFFFLSLSLSSLESFFPPPIPANKAFAFSIFFVSVFGWACACEEYLVTDGLLSSSNLGYYTTVASAGLFIVSG
jgi:hypothetical protein